MPYLVFAYLRDKSLPYMSDTCPCHSFHSCQDTPYTAENFHLCRYFLGSIYSNAAYTCNIK